MKFFSMNLHHILLGYLNSKTKQSNPSKKQEYFGNQKHQLQTHTISHSLSPSPLSPSVSPSLLERKRENSINGAFRNKDEQINFHIILNLPFGWIAA